MNDETIISFVFDKLQRSRWRTLLANPKKREWILNKLEHNPPLDEKNTTFAIHIYLHWISRVFCYYLCRLLNMPAIETKHLYIEKDPSKYEGKAVIKGTRLPVASIVNHSAPGWALRKSSRAFHRPHPRNYLTLSATISIIRTKSTWLLFIKTRFPIEPSGMTISINGCRVSSCVFKGFCSTF